MKFVCVLVNDDCHKMNVKYIATISTSQRNLAMKNVFEQRIK